MYLNTLGNIVNDEWIKTTRIRNEITLDEYQIMPNHMHAIIFINTDVGANGRHAPTVCVWRRIYKTKTYAPQIFVFFGGWF